MKRLFFILIAISLSFTACQQVHQVNINGMAIGTYYSITYIGAVDNTLKHDIDSILGDISSTFSIFDSTSVISKINRNEYTPLPEDFITVFNKAQNINKLTNGAFEPTIGPLINLWGFGKDSITQLPDSSAIDSTKLLVGMDKIHLIDDTIYKDDKQIKLDFNAIAKGFAVDKIAQHLLNKGLKNFIIDIGGEIRCNGMKNKLKQWQIGIQIPTDTQDDLIESDYTFQMQNKGIATSGNYRNYKEENGIRYSHIINPVTGRPEKSSLLSVTVIADDCTTADAFATAFMVLDLEKSKKILQNLPTIAAHFIYFSDGKYQYYQTSNFPKSVNL